MALRFQETMAGTVATAEGPREFLFTATASCGSALALLGWAPLHLEGTATLEGVVDGATLLPGSQLEIGPPLHRFLRYQVHFRDPRGNVYRFFGQKTVFVLRLRRTMTTLVGRLYRNGADVGEATLRFALRDLPQLIGSFRFAAAAA
ncbi:MAG TPA: hypothetical protein VGQ83_12355 [Polyangia bacterium]|jgi:hypothetical protein